MSDEHPDHARVLRILKAWATDATSFQILEPGYAYWFDDSVPAPGAVVAWVQAGRYRVAAGAPIAPREQQGAVAARFIAHNQTEGATSLFFAVEQSFAESLEATKQAPDFDMLKIGEQPEWAPAHYRTDQPAQRSLRAQLNRARNKGVHVRIIDPDELATQPGPVKAEIDTVLQRWLDHRRMSPMAFLVDLQPFHHAQERRYYVAERGAQAVGFLAAIPIYQRGGWFFEDVIRVPDAPNGTVELLVDTAMRDARDKGDDYVTLGLAPLAGISTEAGPHRGLRRALHSCYHRLGSLYHFAGVRHFKNRFHPNQWEPQFLLQSPPRLGLGAVHAVLRAFAGRGLFAFGLDTVKRWLGRIQARRWSNAVLALALLLIPWTVVLAMADGPRWFGSASIQSAWVAFDSLMVCALGSLGFALRRRWEGARSLALLLSGATLADVVLTTTQAFHLHQDLETGALLFVLAGIGGPVVATLLLVALTIALPVNRKRRP